MRITTTLMAWASLLSAGNMFLIVPTPAQTSDEGTIGEWLSDSNKIIEAECYHCPEFSRIDGPAPAFVAGEKKDYKLRLNFDTRDRELLLNGATIFPPKAANPSLVKTFQYDSHGTGDLLTMQLGYALEFEVGKSESDDEELGLVSVDFTVLALEGVEVKTRTVNLKVLTTATQFVLMEAKKLPFHPMKSRVEMCNDSSYPWLCQVREAFLSRTRAMMEAASTKTTEVKEWMKTHGPGNKVRPCPGSRFGPAKGGHSGPHHGFRNGQRHRGGHGFMNHWRMRSWSDIIIKSILIPLFAGFLLGMFIIACTSLLRFLIISAWQRLYRGGGRGSAQNVRVVEVEIEEGEKVALMHGLDADEEVAPPPAYRDEEIVVVSEKN